MVDSIAGLGDTTSTGDFGLEEQTTLSNLRDVTYDNRVCYKSPNERSSFELVCVYTPESLKQVFGAVDRTNQ
jgi:hypothetical protein